MQIVHLANAVHALFQERNSGALVISSMLDFLTYALCAPYSETTVGDRFDVLLDLVAARGRVLYKLFQFPSMTIVKGAGLIMRALIEVSLDLLVSFAHQLVGIKVLERLAKLLPGILVHSWSP